MNNIFQCWHCDSTYDKYKYFCLKCKKIQKPIEIDAFKTFELPYSFDIDFDNLENLYFGLQKKLHPDIYINKTKNELIFSQMHTSNLNNAYSKLNNIISRADELLKIFNVENDKNTSYNDEDVLTEIMELQLESNEIENKECEKVFLEKICNQVNNLSNELSMMFKEKKFDNVNKIKIKISYLLKIKKNLKNGTITN